MKLYFLLFVLVLVKAQSQIENKLTPRLRNTKLAASGGLYNLENTIKPAKVSDGKYRPSNDGRYIPDSRGKYDRGNEGIYKHVEGKQGGVGGFGGVGAAGGFGGFGGKGGFGPNGPFGGVGPKGPVGPRGPKGPIGPSPPSPKSKDASEMTSPKPLASAAKSAENSIPLFYHSCG